MAEEKFVCCRTFQRQSRIEKFFIIGIISILVLVGTITLILIVAIKKDQDSVPEILSNSTETLTNSTETLWNSTETLSNLTETLLNSPELFQTQEKRF